MFQYPESYNQRYSYQSHESRTIVLRNINQSVTLSQLLDHIDFGPIEYIKLVLKPTPQNILQDDDSFSKTLKVCYISFINYELTLQFNNYLKNQDNFQKLKDGLHSKYLKWLVNDNGQNDFVKMKTVDYIEGYGGTRCVKLGIKFVENDKENILDSNVNESHISNGKSLDDSVSRENVNEVTGEIVKDNSNETNDVTNGVINEISRETNGIDNDIDPQSNTIVNDTIIPRNDTQETSEITSNKNTIDPRSNGPRESSNDIDTKENFTDPIETSSARSASPASSISDSDEVVIITKQESTINDLLMTASTTPENESTPLITIRNFIVSQCCKFGDIEHFKLSLNKQSGTALVHFTSIDSAIKAYEYYARRIVNDKQRIEDGLVRKSKLKYDIQFTTVNFNKDRCDKNSLTTQVSKLSINSNKNSSLNHDEILSLDLGVMDKEVLSPPDSPLLSASSSPPQKPYDRSFGYGCYDNSFNNSFTSFNSYNGYPQPGPPNFHPPPTPPHHYNGYHNLPQTPMSKGYSNGHDMNHNAAAVAVAAANAAANAAATAAAAAANYQINPDPYNHNNRTIYLGNLHPNTTIEEIANNVRAGGLVELINYHPDKKVCFITFVDPLVALKFYLNHQVLHQLIIHGYDITVSWAKNHSGPLSREVSLAVTAGASRNVYIGIKPLKDQEMKPVLPTELELRHDFEQFGDLEQINFYHNKDCGFLNFLNIIDAIKVVEIFEMDEVSGRLKISKLIPNSDAFYDKYTRFKISFAKDRCGNPPKFSFKKKLSNVPGSTYQQYQHQLHGSVNRRKGRRQSEEYDEETRSSQHQSYMEDTINEETAMVFGIISNEKAEQEKNKSTKGSEGDDVEDEEKHPDSVSGTNNVDESVKKAVSNTDEFSENNNADEYENEGDDDEDDVSIIIDSDENPTTKTSDDARREESRKINRRVYQSRFDSSDSFVPLRKSTANSSHGSLHYGQQQSYNMYNSSPYMSQQPMFYPPPTPQKSQPYGNGPAGGFGSAYSSADYIPASAFGGYSGFQTPSPGFNGAYNRGGYYPPSSPYQAQHQPQFPSHQYHNQRSHQVPKNAFSTSGSQVMAQYLAKSQHDNLLYAASILQHEESMNEENGYNNDMDHYLRRDSTSTIDSSRYRRSRR